jgi:hypothetical protein
MDKFHIRSCLLLNVNVEIHLMQACHIDNWTSGTNVKS